MGDSARPIAANSIRGPQARTGLGHVLPAAPPSAPVRYQACHRFRPLAPGLASHASNIRLNPNRINITVVNNAATTRPTLVTQQEIKGTCKSDLGGRFIQLSKGSLSVRSTQESTSGLSKLLHAASTGEVTITKVATTGTFVPHRGKQAVTEPAKRQEASLKGGATLYARPPVFLPNRISPRPRVPPRTEMHATCRGVTQVVPELPRVLESAATADASRGQNSFRNLAVVHPQVRTSAPVVGQRSQGAPKVLAPAAAVSETKGLESPKARVLNERGSLGQVGSTSAACVPARAAEGQNLSNEVTVHEAQTNVGPGEAQKSEAVMVDLTDEQTGVAQDSKEDSKSCADAGGQDSRPPVLVSRVNSPLNEDGGRLQVPSGLKVDFINLDDLLIGDLHYLVKHFGQNILDPLSMDDIAKKGFSEWIDVTNPAEMEKTLSELEASKEDSTCPVRWSPDTDFAYPIVVPGTTSSTSPPQASPSGQAADHRPSDSKQSRSPLILIIKKGGRNGLSSTPWQLTSREKTGNDGTGTKAVFLNALNLYPNTEEVAKKLRKGRSARSLAVLKDRVMSEYLKNYNVPLHRVQGMYRYLFKKGHLREGKMTYACEVYRNLRSRESRRVTALVRDDDSDQETSGRASTSAGLLWHLKSRKAVSKPQQSSDVVYRRFCGGIQKSHKGLWKNTRGPLKCTVSLTPKVSKTPWSPPYRVVDGNWKAIVPGDSRKWGLWVSENTREDKMAHPAPVVVLRRISDPHQSSAQTNHRSVVAVYELYCTECCFSCLNKASLKEHFARRHSRVNPPFISVPLKALSVSTPKMVASAKDKGEGT